MKVKTVILPPEFVDHHSIMVFYDTDIIRLNSPLLDPVSNGVSSLHSYPNLCGRKGCAYRTASASPEKAGVPLALSSCESSSDLLTDTLLPDQYQAISATWL
jgi:hypothetical protein